MMSWSSKEEMQPKHKPAIQETSMLIFKDVCVLASHITSQLFILHQS